LNGLLLAKHTNTPYTMKWPTKGTFLVVRDVFWDFSRYILLNFNHTLGLGQRLAHFLRFLLQCMFWLNKFNNTKTHYVYFWKLTIQLNVLYAKKGLTLFDCCEKNHRLRKLIIETILVRLLRRIKHCKNKC
jgi:hypothetical protein